MFWFLVLAASTVVAFWVEWRLKNRHLLEKASKVPGPPTVPVLGNALKFIVPSEDFFTVLGQLKEEYGQIFRFWLGPDLNYCVSNPDYVKLLLTSNKTSAKGPQYKYMVDFLGYGILSGSETLFGLNREQTLNLPHLQTIVDQTHRVYLEAFMRMTTWYLQIQPLYLISTYYLRHKKFIRNTLAMGDAIVKHRLKQLNTIDYKPETEANLDNNNEADKNLSTVDKLIFTKAIPNYNDMLKQIFTIFTTSQETSANIASFLLLMMAYHSKCQDKLYAEIKSVFGDADRAVTDEDIKQMPYLDMVFKEVIRLFPIGSLLQRTVMEDIDISYGISLPAGSSLVVPIFHLHRDKEFFSNPNTFDPERFSEENSKLRHPHCYIPFSLGSMDCLGRHFGTKLVKTISIRVLREYRLTSPETYEDLKLVCAVSVESLNGYPVYLHPRDT